MKLILAAAFLAAPQGWSAFDQADAELNSTYKLLRAHMAPQGRRSLQASERDWIRARDKRCGVNARNACATRLTREQTTKLSEVLERNRSFEILPRDALARLERTADDACRAPGQDADGAVCRRRDELVDLLKRRGGNLPD